MPVRLRPNTAALRPLIGLGAGHFPDQVAANDAGGFPRLPGYPRRVEVAVRDQALLGAVVAEVRGEGARVDALDAHDAVLTEVLIQGLPAPPVAGIGAGFLDDEAGQPRLFGLVILGVDPVVADVRVRHRDHLSPVRGIREDLLIAGERGVEDDLAGGLAGGPQGRAFEDGSVRQRQDRRCHRAHLRAHFFTFTQSNVMPSPRLVM